MSGIYVVFRPNRQEHIPSAYILRLLKSPSYLRIIRAYDTRGSVRANLSWDQLCRIKIAVPTSKDVETFMEQHAEIEALRNKANIMEEGLSKMVSGGDNAPTGHRSVFDAPIKRSVLGEEAPQEDGTSDPASS